MAIDKIRYESWKEQVFGTGYEIWHDGLYTGHVTSMKGAERDEALEMLRFGLAQGDPHAAQALSDLGDAGSLDAILANAAVAHGSAKVTAALSAHRLAPDPALAGHLVEVLRGAPSWTDRIDAAIGLRVFAGADDEGVLLDAVRTDPDYLVRYHAAESLLARWRAKPAEIAKHPEIFRRIAGPTEGVPGPAHFEAFAEGARMLEALRPRR